ncbi:aspartate/glutamate racemase family protein [Streptomyces hundungensis]|uniref:aspartate/glutamate racemase family protein n=1 Tax=Streptomyces hundungensis TaxID=1077946 RepID=UPI0031E96657
MVRRVRPALGILGGMGPLATADFYRRLVARTPAASDQGHLPVLMWADPSVPDRTAALLGQGPSPVPALVAGARWLKLAGARCVAIPCNTAHAYADQVAKTAGVEVLDMIQAALLSASGVGPSTSRVGILATRGTRRARLYEKAGARLGIDVLQVPVQLQSAYVDPAIRAVKAGAELTRPEQQIAAAAGALRELGAQVVIAACTEIPLISGVAARIVPVVDSTEALVDAAVSRLWGCGPGFAPSDGSADASSSARTNSQGFHGPNLRR